MSDTFTVEAGEPLEVTVEHCGTPDAEVVVTVGQMPESHAATHAAGGIDPLQIISQQITDFTTAAIDTVTWITITGKPSTFAPSAHAHPISDVTGLQTALDGKQVAGSYAALVHTHGISDVTGLQTALDNKAAASHTHTIANVTGLQSALDAKATPADVSSAVAAVVNAAPATLDTLNELAAALGNDASFATTVTNALAAKAPLASPTFTGTVSGVTKAMVGLGNVPNVDATARANHTGTQTASTISDFTAAVVAAAPPTTDASLLTTGTLSASRLPSTTVAAGSYGSASSVATYTVDATGRLTAAGSTSIAIAAGAVSGLAAVATSGSASDLSGTLADSRLSTNARQAIDNLFHPFLLAGM